MSETTRTRTHAPEIRQRAVEILQEGVGHRALAAELGIPQATARQWARAYAVGGADAVLNAGSHHHTYSFDVKLAVVKDRLEHGLRCVRSWSSTRFPASLRLKLGADSIATVARPPWSISRGVVNRALKRRNSERDGASAGAHFSCRANFLDRRESIGTSFKVVNKPRAVARAPAATRGGASPLCSKADMSLPHTPKTPQLTENLPPELPI